MSSDLVSKGMDSSSFRGRAFSAPGKALLVGGYLVLDPQYQSYVVALSSRMHAVVSQAAPNDNSELSVTIKSTQFNNDQWDYKVTRESYIEVTEVNGRKNPFAEKVVEVVINYCQPHIETTGDIVVEIYSDPGYHSVGNSVLKENGYKSFRFHNNTITRVPKTGLGSSAGLVTVLVTALLSLFKKDLDIHSEKDLNTIHNLSQIAHCQAQGKVGSGFDVAAAVFGSILYERFDAAFINNMPSSQSASYGSALRTLVDETDWNFRHDKITLPPGLRLIMGDVASGSETTKLVTKVKAWYEKNYPRSLEVYRKINEGNSKFIQGIERLTQFSKTSPSEYKLLLKALDEGSSLKKYDIITDIKEAIEQVRSNFRLITTESGAEVEPEVQTRLLDRSIALKGVVTGVVPGAGGYDAVTLVATETSNIPTQTANDEAFSAVSWLDLRQESTGIEEENPTHYVDFI